MAETDPPHVRLLLVEDSDIDAELLAAHLEKADFGFTIERVIRREEYLSALRRGGFDLILSDYSLPDFDGLIALDHARAICPELPFIFVSGMVGEEFATNALRRGAIDYILKRNLSRVGTSVVRALADAQRRVERVRAVAELRTSERNLRTALKAGGFGTWALDLRTSELTTSTVCRQNFGRDPEQPFSYEALRAAVHPADQARMQQAVADAIQSQSDYDIEYRIVTPAGAIRWVSVRGQTIYDERGEPLQMTGVSGDITGRRLAEIRRDALSRLTDRIRDSEDAEALAFDAASILGETLDVAHAGYGIVDPQAETVFIKREWNAPGVNPLPDHLSLRHHGSFVADVIRGDTIVVSDVKRDPRISECASHLAAAGVGSFVNLPVSEDDRVVAILYVSHTSARDWSAEDVGLIREFAERTRTAVERLRISEALRESEARLREANETLESKIAQRTAELIQASEALRQSQKMEAVGQLTGGLAHDFNNLLAGISGSIEVISLLIKRGRFNDLERYLTAAQNSSRRAAALTQRLLAFSRRQTLDPKATDVNHLIEGMVELVCRTVGPSIRVDVSGAPDLWVTRLDASQLESALLNLCINARDAMPASGGTIRITSANRSVDETVARAWQLPPGEYVEVCVTDDGSGMEPQVLDKIFEPFFTTKPLGQGTGLGLSMVYGFVRQSGGQVRVTSEVGKGTTICLRFPRFMGEVDAAAVISPVELRSGGGETIVVIDDEPDVRMLIQHTLTDSGYTVQAAEDGAAGLKLLENNASVGLLITDVGLPGGLNGRQVADAGRELIPKLKVLFITGFDEHSVVGSGQLPPGMSVITKPFPMATLASKVRELIERTQPDASSNDAPI